MRSIKILLIISFFVIFISTHLFAQSEALKWYNRGQKETSQEEKIKCFQKTIELMPKFIEAHHSLARAFRSTGRLEEALEAYQNALKSNPSLLDEKLKRTILFEMSLVYEKQNRYQEAEKTFLEVLALSKDSSVKAMVLCKLGLINYSMQKFDTAIDYYKQGIKIYPTNKNSLESFIAAAEKQKELYTSYNEGSSLLIQNKFAEAITAFETVLNIDPEYKDAKQLIAKARDRYNTQKTNQELKMLYDKGLASYQSNDWQGAIEAMEIVVAKSPNYEKAKEYLSYSKQKQKINQERAMVIDAYKAGVNASKKGDYVNAIIAFERVRELDPNYKDISTRIQQIQKRFEEYDDKAIKSQYYTSGLKAFESGNYQEALNTFNKLYSLDPNYQDVYTMITQSKQKISLGAKQGTVDIYYQRGVELMQQGDWLNAFINFEKVNIISPNYKDVNKLIAQARQNFENPQSDELVAEEAKTSSSSSPLLAIGFIFTALSIPFWTILLSPHARARFYLMQKKYDKARQIYETMLHHNPHKVKLYISLANIYINENRKDEFALKVFEKVIESDVSEQLKIQLQPILNQYYLSQGKKSENRIVSLEDSLREELKNLGD